MQKALFDACYKKTEKALFGLVQMHNKQFLTHAIKIFILESAFWACATAQQAKTASDEDEKALFGAYYKKK